MSNKSDYGSDPSMTSPVLIDEKLASELSGLPVSWYRRKRVEGGGPPFVKLTPGPKGPVRYNRAKLLAWFEARERSSTSEQVQ